MKAKLLAIVHFLILILLIVWNYYANTGYIDGKTIGSISDKYANLFTPAPYAFSIWGIIFIGLVAHGAYLLNLSFSKNKDIEPVLRSTPWLILSHIGTGAWVYFWLKEQLAFSVVIMLFILLFLLMAVVKLNMEKWDAPLKTIAGVWWPIDLYIGWISVTLVANIAAYLSSIGFQGGLTEIEWTIIMIGVVTILNLAMVAFRNMREFTAVGMWALVAIAVRHWGEIPEIQWSAMVAVILLAFASSVHAYKNRKTLPFIRS